MLNSSGAPALDNTRSLRGVHIGICYHLDEVHAQNQASKSFDVWSSTLVWTNGLS